MSSPPRKSRHIALTIAILLLLGCGAFFWANKVFSERQAAVEEPPPRAPVKWMAARQFFLEEWTEVVGTTQPLPAHSARLTARVEGHVLSVLDGANGKPAVEGQTVKKGDVIVRLDASLAQAHLDKSVAFQEELKQLTKQASLAVKLAKLDLKRLEELMPRGAAGDKAPLISRYEMEKAEVNLADAESKLKLAELRERTGQKDLEILEEEVKHLSITAPIDGKLGRLLVVQGQTLTPGTWVADIVNVEDQLDVLCFVPAPVAKRLEIGQVALIGGFDEPHHGSDATMKGKVQYIADQAEIDTGNFALKIRFANNTMKLRASTTLRLRIMTNPGKACLTLPEAALFEDEEPPSVIVVDDYKQTKNKEGKEIEMGIARKLQVTTGIRDRNLHLVEIVAVTDKDNKWQGKLEDANFVVERGRGLRTEDPVQLLVEED
jgi:RND family efflux transporter MFP subunit